MDDALVSLPISDIGSSTRVQHLETFGAIARRVDMGVASRRSSLCGRFMEAHHQVAWRALNHEKSCRSEGPSHGLVKWQMDHLAINRLSLPTGSGQLWPCHDIGSVVI